MGNLFKKPVQPSPGVSPSSTDDSTNREKEGKSVVENDKAAEEKPPEKPESVDTSYGVEATAVRTLAASTGTVAILGTTANTLRRPSDATSPSNLIPTVVEEFAQDSSALNPEEAARPESESSKAEPRPESPKTEQPEVPSEPRDGETPTVSQLNGAKNLPATNQAESAPAELDKAPQPLTEQTPALVAQLAEGNPSQQVSEQSPSVSEPTVDVSPTPAHIEPPATAEAKGDNEATEDEPITEVASAAKRDDTPQLVNDEEDAPAPTEQEQLDIPSATEMKLELTEPETKHSGGIEPNEELISAVLDHKTIGTPAIFEAQVTSQPTFDQTPTVIELCTQSKTEVAVETGVEDVSTGEKLPSENAERSEVVSTIDEAKTVEESDVNTLPIIEQIERQENAPNEPETEKGLEVVEPRVEEIPTEEETQIQKLILVGEQKAGDVIAIAEGTAVTETKEEETLSSDDVLTDSEAKAESISEVTEPTAVENTVVKPEVEENRAVLSNTINASPVAGTEAVEEADTENNKLLEVSALPESRPADNVSAVEILKPEENIPPEPKEEDSTELVMRELQTEETVEVEKQEEIISRNEQVGSPEKSVFEGPPQPSTPEERSNTVSPDTNIEAKSDTDTGSRSPVTTQLSQERDSRSDTSPPDGSRLPDLRQQNSSPSLELTSVAGLKDVTKANVDEESPLTTTEANHISEYDLSDRLPLPTENEAAVNSEGSTEEDSSMADVTKSCATASQNKEDNHLPTSDETLTERDSKTKENGSEDREATRSISKEDLRTNSALMDSLSEVSNQEMEVCPSTAPIGEEIPRGESERMEEAATKIQAAVRGYQTRRNLNLPHRPPKLSDSMIESVRGELDEICQQAIHVTEAMLKKPAELSEDNNETSTNDKEASLTQISDKSETETESHLQQESPDSTLNVKEISADSSGKTQSPPQVQEDKSTNDKTEDYFENTEDSPSSITGNETFGDVVAEDELPLQDLDQHASKIQAGVRGFLARKKVSAMKEAKLEEERSSNRDEEMEVSRGDERITSTCDDDDPDDFFLPPFPIELDQDFHLLPEDERQQKIDDENIKYDMIKEKLSISNCEDEAATTLSTEESTFRECQNRNLKRINEAATKIQAEYRGFKVRKTCSANKESEEKINKNDEESIRCLQNESAAKIQAGIRGYLVRKKLRDKKAAAIKIQAGYRGFKVRKERQCNKK